MIVKILSSSGGFGGIRYNTDKMQSGKGELMTVRNFGALQGLGNLKPEDYRNYLKMISATNKRVKQPQFHAAISTAGREYDKHQLTEIAMHWLEKMGYGQQPYLIVFHNDTNNNHVHLVSTRIDRGGKKINSGFENIRALQNLNLVLGIDEKHNAQKDATNALGYSFSTIAQFKLILESRGYKLSEKENGLNLIRFGKVQGFVAGSAINLSLGKIPPSDNRVAQLTALMHKYPGAYDMPGFISYLKEKYGVILILHAKDGKGPYGYTIIDHAAKAVYKGGHVMPLPKLMNIINTSQGVHSKPDRANNGPLSLSPHDRKAYYTSMLRAAIHNFPDIRQGLYQLGIKIYMHNDQLYLVDTSAQTYIPLDQLLVPGDYAGLIQQIGESGEVTSGIGQPDIYIPPPIVAPSIDDEAINGRNRRRKKHPRTNSR